MSTPGFPGAELLSVCAGGAVGSGLRYLLGRWLNQPGRSLPLGTLAANALGAFLLAWLMSQQRLALSPRWKLALTTGAMGGFTTYSTFNYETLKLLQGENPLQGALYLGATLLLCLGGGLLGLTLGGGR